MNSDKNKFYIKITVLEMFDRFTFEIDF